MGNEIFQSTLFDNRDFAHLDIASQIGRYVVDVDSRCDLQVLARQKIPMNNSVLWFISDLYLVDNQIDRWSISDRTPNLEYAEDGSLTLLLSAEPPSKTSNWLPVPAGPFMLGLRVYEGLPDVIDCNWFPPALMAS